MGLIDIFGEDPAYAVRDFAAYLVDNVLVAVLVGITVYLIQDRIERRHAQSLRQLESDKYVAKQVQPFMDAVIDSSLALKALSDKPGSMTDEDAKAFADLHARQDEQIARLQMAQEFNRTAFLPYKQNLEACKRIVDDMRNVYGNEEGPDEILRKYSTCQRDLEDACKQLTNKSLTAVAADKRNASKRGLRRRNAQSCERAGD